METFAPLQQRGRGLASLDPCLGAFVLPWWSGCPRFGTLYSSPIGFFRAARRRKMCIQVRSGDTMDAGGLHDAGARFRVSGGSGSSSGVADARCGRTVCTNSAAPVLSVALARACVPFHTEAIFRPSEKTQIVKCVVTDSDCNASLKEYVISLSWSAVSKLGAACARHRLRTHFFLSTTPSHATVAIL